MALFLSALLLSALNVLLNPNVPPMVEPIPEGHVALDTVRQWDHVLWVDARAEQSYRKASLPDAILCNEETFDSGLGNILEVALEQPGIRIVVFCDSSQCDSSSVIAKKLRELLPEYDVWVLHRGWEALRHAQQK